MINRINVSSINNYHKNLVTRQTFTGHDGQDNKMTTKQKAVVLASSTLGMASAFSILAKRKGFSLNPVRILKTPIKDWAIFKYSPTDKAVQFDNPAPIIGVASGSIAGGYIGGALIDDKANLKAKKREVLNQILGNVLVPVSCVGLGSTLYENYANRIENAMPQLKFNNSFVNILNKCLKKIPNAACTVALLGAGIYLGNKVSNLINEKLYHKKVDRNIRATDFAPHVDDACMSITMMNKASDFGSKLARVVPFALIVPGYETGTARD